MSGGFQTPRLGEEQEKSHLVGWNFTLCLQASGGPGATAEAQTGQLHSSRAPLAYHWGIALTCVHLNVLLLVCWCVCAYNLRAGQIRQRPALASARGVPSVGRRYGLHESCFVYLWLPREILWRPAANKLRCTRALNTSLYTYNTHSHEHGSVISMVRATQYVKLDYLTSTCKISIEYA